MLIYFYANIFLLFWQRSAKWIKEMTTAPRGGLGNGPSSTMGGGIYDPSVLFDLDEIMMGGGDSNELHTSLIHTPIKEEPEYDHDDNRYNMVAKH